MSEFSTTSCEGKERFDSPVIAHRVQQRMRKRDRQNRGLVAETYRCKLCGGWHIGQRDVKKVRN